MADVGAVRYVAVPIMSDGGEALGVFVVAAFADLARAEVEGATRAAAGVLMATLVIASLLAYLSAGRALAPVRLVTETARRISDSDLGQRIPVEGNDEISQLAVTFNEMLERLEQSLRHTARLHR